MTAFEDGSDVCIFSRQKVELRHQMNARKSETDKDRGQLECRLLKNTSKNLIRPTSFVVYCSQ